MAAANTGRDRRSRTTVTSTDQVNRGIRCGLSSLWRIFRIVEIKFRLPRIEDTPARWREKIARSILGPGCPKSLDRGG